MKRRDTIIQKEGYYHPKGGVLSSKGRDTTIQEEEYSTIVPCRDSHTAGRDPILEEGSSRLTNTKWLEHQGTRRDLKI